MGEYRIEVHLHCETLVDTTIKMTVCNGDIVAVNYRKYFNVDKVCTVKVI